MQRNIQLDPSNMIPLYLQIVNEMSRLISEGTLPPGHRLPATRQLARTLAVARIDS